MQIAPLLNIGRGVTALIGGGGKTTMLYTLTEELRKKGTVLLCTSTHIMRPTQYEVLERVSEAEVSAALAAHGAQPLDRRFPVDDGVRKGNCAANGRRPLQIGHHHIDTAAPQSHGSAACDISCAANQCKHTYTP